MVGHTDGGHRGAAEGVGVSVGEWLPVAVCVGVGVADSVKGWERAPGGSSCRGSSSAQSASAHVTEKKLKL